MPSGTTRVCLILAPHPDDETIGAGAWMERHGPEGLFVAHVTDGSPRDLADAQRAGFASADAYATARRAEVEAALGLVGIAPERIRRLGFVDKEVCFQLDSLVADLDDLIAELDPALVLTPAYEGGHPDHDATAFAAAMVYRMRSAAFQHREYRLYHADADGTMAVDNFLPAGQGGPERQPRRPNHANGALEIEVFRLSPAEHELKRQMIARFTSQRDVLRNFEHLTDERFRNAPEYDFTRPPHSGPLLYERWGWTITGKIWRACAREALERAHAH
jgi:LmbE family N-acetylglucosaminyl deacetylase